MVFNNHYLMIWRELDLDISLLNEKVCIKTPYEGFLNLEFK